MKPSAITRKPAFLGLLFLACCLSGCATCTRETDADDRSGVSSSGLADVARATSHEDKTAWDDAWWFTQLLLYEFCAAAPSFGVGR